MDLRMVVTTTSFRAMFHQLLPVLTVAVLAGCHCTGITSSSPSTYTGMHSPQVKVQMDLYYETHCPSCVYLYVKKLYNIMKSLGSYINLRTYPYGKATTFENNGNITFECQHGEKECYGNKLHACAIENLPSSWLDFNACLMSGQSDDASADACGRMLNINPEPIKMCAKGMRGSHLLKFYGELSGLVPYKYIPHVVIDGVALDKDDDLATAVYSAIRTQRRA